MTTNRQPWDHGTHEELILFILSSNHDETIQTYELIQAWDQGDLNEWSEYTTWLDAYRESKISKWHGMKPSATEGLALTAWTDLHEGDGLNFKGIWKRSDLKLKQVRRAARSLARKGYLRFANNLTDDEGAMYGAGYVLTSMGEGLLKQWEKKDAP